MSIRKGSIESYVSEEFLKDLVTIITAGAELGANKLKFTLPKPPEIKEDDDIEIMISWRLKNET